MKTATVAIALGAGALYVAHKHKEDKNWTPLGWLTELLIDPVHKAVALEHVKAASVPTPSDAHALDPHQTVAQVKQVNAALSSEIDPQNLAHQAIALKEAGHTGSAVAVAQKAVAVDAAKQLGANDKDIHAKQIEAAALTPAIPVATPAPATVTGWGLRRNHDFMQHWREREQPWWDRGPWRDDAPIAVGYGGRRYFPATPPFGQGGRHHHHHRPWMHPHHRHHHHMMQEQQMQPQQDDDLQGDPQAVPAANAGVAQGATATGFYGGHGGFGHGGFGHGFGHEGFGWQQPFDPYAAQQFADPYAAQDQAADPYAQQYAEPYYPQHYDRRFGRFGHFGRR